MGDQSPAARQRHKESGGLMISFKSFLLASCATALMSSAVWAADPIKIGVIAEAQAVAGSSIAPAAQLAAEEINAKGGVDGRKIEIVVYDNHSSSAESVRAFQRAVSEDKVNAVIASYISEVVLALEPWAGRLKTLMITPGAASDVITQNIAKNYDQLKYTFHGYLTSTSLAGLVCDAAKDLLVEPYKMKTAVIMSEDAAWTTPLDAGYEKCLPEIGLKVVDHIRMSPDTTDFTPIFNKIEGLKPDVMITGISHVGTQPTVQWKSQQVPIPMFGISSQATNSTFWKDTNGAVEGVMFNAVSGPGVAVTPKTLPFVDAYQKKFGNIPSYAGYTSYDDVYMIADAIHRAGGTDPDKMVEAMEATDYVGTIGRVSFKPKGDPNPHALRTGKGYITGLMLQWQAGKQVNVWPKELAAGTATWPSFIKLKAASN
ncbi:putative branched-chain amino acid ABC transporter (substrate-binding protein) [Bradyrhizobium sp. ORS 375]|uniref:ABC transporter substrate-binding protein n=1 Tax=Bradyrhizobium sp. (strain ORS 375) TaxID=566679 RepID=UPI0002407ACE|nr:ABC transporter substrate-binding protein [Bradyrhizobium sp. ORS 375]CCD95460.1 putative branched-chain amino acid ABC transporter (substrate-binding protein) [Bradyrhizobium sp. ORS 375]